jgi:predicted DNA repair protein MutK
MLMSLSIPKNSIEKTFTTIRRNSVGEIWAIFIVLSTELVKGSTAIACHRCNTRLIVTSGISLVCSLIIPGLLAIRVKKGSVGISQEVASTTSLLPCLGAV